MCQRSEPSKSLAPDKISILIELHGTTIDHQKGGGAQKNAK